MFDEVLERNEVRNLLREIVNNPKYYDKGIEEVLKKDYFLQGRIFFLFYEALYKYQSIIEDPDYLFDFINSFETLLKRVDDIDSIKLGISKILCKVLLKKLHIPTDSVENKKEEILKYVYDKYIKNGYYIRGLNKVEYNYFEDTSKVDVIISEEFTELKKILSKYKYNLSIDENLDLNTDFSRACIKSINSPRYLYNLIINNEYIDNNRDAYYLKDYDLCKSNLNKVLNNIKVEDSDKEKINKIFSKIWELYNDKDNDIYLVLIKRTKLGIINDLVINDNYSLEESLYNLFTTYDDSINVNSLTDVDFCIKLPNYFKFLKQEVVEKKEEVKEKKEDIFDFNNEYGKVSIFIIIGTILIILGVVVTVLINI